MTEAEQRIARFEQLIKEHGDPTGVYAAAIEYIRERAHEW